MPKLYDPSIDIAPLFEAVQSAAVFEDSKTFVDLAPQGDPDDILDDYLKQREEEDFSLADFVGKYFKEVKADNDQELEKKDSLSAHLDYLWHYLSRTDDAAKTADSRLPMPKPYIVPGGRFRECYYWDSYFTMLGLLESGKEQEVIDMVDNFAHLIDTYGHIPNGNRTYYLSRSQPPFFSLMVSLVEKLKNVTYVRTKYLDCLIKEWQFWMKGAAELEHNDSKERVVSLEGILLNRYHDSRTDPRPESYIEDKELVDGMNAGHKAATMRHLRAACESGWDFSSRWLKDPTKLKSINTSNVLPVDLNCLLYHLEHYIAHLSSENKDIWQEQADRRKDAINQLFWNAEKGIYEDVNITDQSFTDRPSLAMVFPLCFGMATDEQARSVKEYLLDNFLIEGGLVTTLVETGQQWDAPNGWPPLQYMAVTGLIKYGYKEEATEIINRWCGLCEKTYAKTGKMMEKYNVVDLSLEAGGGEYPLQDGFGWTNGVYLALNQLKKELS